MGLIFQSHTLLILINTYCSIKVIEINSRASIFLEWTYLNKDKKISLVFFDTFDIDLAVIRVIVGKMNKDNSTTQKDSICQDSSTLIIRAIEN